MTEYPNNAESTPPVAPAEYAAVPPPQTSWPKVLGILMIIFGVFGMIAGTLGLFARQLMELLFKQMGKSEIMQSSLMQRWMTITVAFAAIGLLLGILQMVGGIGLVRRKLWAVAMSKAWAAAKIALAVVTMLSDWIMSQKIAEAAKEGLIDADAVKHLVRGGGSLVSMLPGLMMSIALPVFVLIWLALPNPREDISYWK